MKKNNIAKKLATKTSKRKAVRKVAKKTAPKVARKVAPIRIVTIRRDRDKNSWAILDANLNPVEHIDTGILSGVAFGVRDVKTAPVGCMPYGRKSIGVTTGRLIQGKRTIIPLSRVRHFSFNDKGFCDIEGTPLSKAKSVFLGEKGNAFYVV